MAFKDTFSEMLGPVPLTHVLAEFLGTVLFQFFGGACAANAHYRSEKWDGKPQPMAGLPVAALGNGLCLAVLVFCTAGISGGHLNPAVSTGLYATGRLGVRRLILYVSAQLLGATVGACLLRLSLPYTTHPFNTLTPFVPPHPLQTILLEFIATFLLVYTVYSTTVDRKSAADKAAPLTIGLSVTVGVFAIGPYTGGALNPARTIGPAIAFMEPESVGIYVLACLCGGIAAAMFYDGVHLDEQPAEAKDRDE
jgi:MIP family channel proteins